MKWRLLWTLAILATAGVALASDSKMPDGSQFPMWEKPLHFTNTYYVDCQAKNADDNGPGTKERPFRTINKAAQVLAAGRTGGDCRRRVSRGHPPAQRRNGAGGDDQLRSRARREGRREGLGRGQGLASERGLELRLRSGHAAAGARPGSCISIRRSSPTATTPSRSTTSSATATGSTTPRTTWRTISAAAGWYLSMATRWSRWRRRRSGRAFAAVR